MVKPSLIARAAAAAALAAVAFAIHRPGTEIRTYLSPASCPPLSAAPTGEPLPGGFAAVEARRCTYAVSGRGGWTWRSVQRATGPLDDLVQALRTPPPEHDGKDPICTTIALPPTAIALTDGTGRTVMPDVPGTPCRTPVPEMTAAINALTWQ